MGFNSENKKRVVKNTLILYMRMIFIMLVSLYTSRINLNALGVEDYGVYNVVGGVVVMFSLLSNSLSSAISRFITYELGADNIQRLKDIFCMSVTIQMVLSLIIVVLMETVGVWFLNTYVVIPKERVIAANWVFQFSILSFVLGLMSVPYNACIIAHEKMSIFSCISILEAVCKLAVSFIIWYSPIDRLIFLSAMFCIIGIITRILYGIYCARHIPECHYYFLWDFQLFKQMFSFAGWNFIGCTAGLFQQQGVAILLNIFFGCLLNAVSGIAGQVNAAISSFVRNFMMALNPQITKSYASGDLKYMMTLIFQGARFSFYILLLLALPVILSTHFILVIWLKQVPEHTVTFVQLTLIFAMSESISNPLITAQLATGRLRNYQLIVGGQLLLCFPLSYVCLKLGLPPESVVVVNIVMSQCCLAARLIMLRGMIGIRVREYLRRVYFNVLLVAVLSASVPILLSLRWEEGWAKFLGLTLVCLACTGAVILFVGCNRKERVMLRTQAVKMKRKLLPGP